MTRERLPTAQPTAQYLSPEADCAIRVPGLRVDPDETGDGGNRKESEHRSLWILVSFKNLHISKSTGLRDLKRNCKSDIFTNNITLKFDQTFPLNWIKTFSVYRAIWI